MKKSFLFILVVTLSAFSCKTIKMETDPAKVSPMIVYSKGPCFGKCPIYTLTIYNSGLAKFNGIRFTEKSGKYEKQLSLETFTELIDLFENNRFWRFDDLYGMELVDAPTVTVSYSYNDKTKTVKGKSHFPEKLEEIMTRLDTFEKDNDGWFQTEKPVNVNKNETIVENQIIIKAAVGMIMSTWLQEYKQYGVRLLKKIGEGEDIWLIRYDINKIKPEEMMKILKSDKYISEAEFNTKISDRED